MASPTTLRGELLRERRTINDRFFLTLGDGTAGMSPYNPLQVGLGVTFRVLTNNNVTGVRMLLRRVTDTAEAEPGIVLTTKIGGNEWRAEGAIGGETLGFPQPVPNYHTPQCFELELIARNRNREIRRVYNFWVGDGFAGTIVNCHDRELIAAKPIICCFDGIIFRDPGYGWPDEFAAFFANNGSPAMSCIDGEGQGLLPDPAVGVYVPGAPDPITNVPASADPWARLPEPAVPVLSIIEQMEADMARAKAGHGPQYFIRPIEPNELWWHGTIRKARRGAPAGVPPAGGTGVPNTLVANPQIGNQIGGFDSGPNIGYPRGIDGIRIEFVSGESWGPTADDDFVFNIVLDDWAPADVNGTVGVHVLVGVAADWAGAGVGGQAQLDSTEPAHLLCSVNQATNYYDAPNGGVAWPAANTIGATIGLLKNQTHQFVLRQSTSGVTFTAGVTYAVQVIAHIPGVINVGGAGYFGRLFPVNAIRSNVLRLVAAP